MGRLAWNFACVFWVLAPTVGRLPGFDPIEAQRWWFLLSSLSVIATGWWVQPKRSVGPAWAWVALGWLALFLAHQDLNGWTIWRVLNAVVALISAREVALKGEAGLARGLITAAAAIQIPVITLQWFGIWTPWDGVIETGAYPGTAIKRAGAAALLAIASIMHKGWLSALFALFSLGTGSLAGGPVAAARVLGRWMKPLGQVGLMALVSFAALFLAVAGEQVIYRALPRLEIWLAVIDDSTFLGHGFDRMHIGFFDKQASAIYTLSSFIDWLYRAGWLGLAALCAWLGWAWKKTEDKWLWLTAVSVGLVQSSEHLVVLTLLACLWWIHMEER